MSNRSVNVVLGLVAGCLACTPARYRPMVPMQGPAGELRLSMRELKVGTGLQVVYETHSSTSREIRGARLTVPSRSACSGGADVDRIEVDGRGGTALPAGTHELSLAFDTASDMSLDLVVDVSLRDGACVRAPALSQSLPMRSVHRFAMVGSLDLQAGQNLRGFGAGFTVRGGGATWLGPVMLSGEVGVGSAYCDTPTCPEESGGPATRVMFPLAVDALYSFPAQALPNGLSAWRAGAGYSLFPVLVPATDGDRRFAVHGIHAKVGWAMGPLAGGKGPFLDASRSLNVEVLMPVGVWLDPGGGSRKVGFSAGFAFRFLSPL